MKYFLLSLLLISNPTMAGKIGGETLDQDVELPYHHPRSKIGQDPITYNETVMCHHLEDQAWNGPLSHRRNLTGSIGTCDRKTGVCAIYWLDTDICDVVDTANLAVDRRRMRPPTAAQKLQNMHDAVDACNDGTPKFGPQIPCETLELQAEQMEREYYTN